MRTPFILPVILVLAVILIISVIVFIPTETSDSPSGSKQSGALGKQNASLDRKTPHPPSTLPSPTAQTLPGNETDSSLDTPAGDKTAKNGMEGNTPILSATESTTVQDSNDQSAQTAGQAQKATNGVIQGIVVDPTDSPLAGVSLQISGNESIMSGMDGRFRFTNVQVESVRLKAELHGFYPVMKEKVSVGANNVRLTMIPEGTIAGKVMDQFGNAIASAGIKAKLQKGIWIKDYTTDREGRFEITDPPEGAMSLQATQEGYADKGEGQKTVTPPVSELVILRLHQPTYSISGRVIFKESNTGVANFSLVAELEETAKESEIKTATTDAAGMYQFEDLQIGTYRVSCQARENASLNLTVPLDQDFKNVRVSDRDVTNVDFFAVRGLTVSGSVVTQSGEPVRGAEVTVAKLASAKTSTDADGLFTLRNIPTYSQGYTVLPRDFTLQLLATHADHGTGQSDPLPANPSQSVENITIVLFDSCSLSGTIADPAGTPIPGVQIQLRDIIQNQVKESQTDANGRFALANIPSVAQPDRRFRGTHILNIRKEGYETKHMELVFQPGENKTLAIELENGNMIRGYVSDKNRKPLGGVQVTAFMDQGGTLATTTDETGIYQFNSLPAGNYDLKFRLSSTPSLSAYLYQVPAGSDDANATLVHQEWISMGTVFDKETNQPINQYMISVEGNPASQPNRTFAFTKSVNSPDGSYQLVFDEPGLYRYRFTAPNYHPNEGKVKIVQGVMHKQILNAWLEPLQSKGGLRGQFRSSAGYLLAGINVLGVGSYPASGNQFILEDLPTGMHDLLFYAKDPANGRVFTFGVLPQVPVQADNLFDIGVIEEGRLSAYFRE
ncbi:hypothetical protein GF373_07770 [bacterium]|nr:hypothetical protein [bacterium]